MNIGPSLCRYFWEISLGALSQSVFANLHCTRHSLCFYNETPFHTNNTIGIFAK